MKNETRNTKCRELHDSELDAVAGGATSLREIGEAVVQAARGATHSSKPISYSLRWGI